MEALLSEAPPEEPLVLLGEEAPDALLPDGVEPALVPPALLELTLSPACSGAAACSSRESLPSPFLSSVLKSLSCGVPLASSLLMKPSLSLSNPWNIFSAPDIVAPVPAEPALPDAVEPDPEEPAAEPFSVALGALVVLLGLALPADPLLLPVVCAANGAAKAAATAKAITVLTFISVSLRFTKIESC